MNTTDIPTEGPACNEERRIEGLRFPAECTHCGIGPCKIWPPPPIGQLWGVRVRIAGVRDITAAVNHRHAVELAAHLNRLPKLAGLPDDFLEATPVHWPEKRRDHHISLMNYTPADMKRAGEQYPEAFRKMLPCPCKQADRWGYQVMQWVGGRHSWQHVANARTVEGALGWAAGSRWVLIRCRGCGSEAIREYGPEHVSADDFQTVNDSVFPL